MSITNGPDLINGTSAANTIDGLGGNDIIFARAGDDVVEGGGDDDLIFGQAGADSLSGGDGEDRIVGGRGADTIDGGSGNDTMAYEEALFAEEGSITVELNGGGDGWVVRTFTVEDADIVSEGVDRLSDVEVVEDADGARVLLVGAGGFGTLQEAVDEAVDGDTILIAAGTYAGATISGKALTIRGQGAGSTTIDGQITIDGTVTGDTVIEDLAIDASGQQYGVLYNAVAGKAEMGLTLDGVAVSGAIENGLLYVRPGNSANPTITTELLSDITIRDSVFTDNGTRAGSNARAHVNLFGFNGDLTVVDNAFVVTSDDPAGAARKGFSWSGAPRTGTLSPAGDVEFTGNDFTGYYLTDVIALYYFASFASFTAGGNTADVSAPWGVLNADVAPTVLDVSGFFAGTPLNAIGPIAVLQGAEGSADTLNGTDQADVLYGRGGLDYLEGGAGDDSFTIVLSSEHGAGETIAGGDGTDTINFFGFVPGDTLVLTTGVTGVEAARIVAGGVSPGAGLPTPIVTTGTTALSIDASAVTGLATLAGNDGANALTAGAGAQTITGNGGNDTLAGGEGDDSLAGGAGTDVASFAAGLTVGDFTVEGGRWIVTTATEGTDTLGDVEEALSGTERFLLVGADGYATIQEAVDAAGEGDTIVVAAGSYAENVVIGTSGITLLSVGGREVTIIAGNGMGSELGAVQLTPGLNGVRIGDAGQGFTILGLNGNGAIEKGAVYLQGNHSGHTIEGNEIVAQGDAGLMSEAAGDVDDLTVTGNIFSGQTFVGTEPEGIGFATQFDPGNNVPRQLVVLGNGGGVNQSSSNIAFTDNLVTGTAGGTNGGGAQGNTLVTIDAQDSLVEDNTFTGFTDRFGTAIRVRGPGTDVIGNTLDHTTGGASRGIFVQNANGNSVFSGNVVLGAATGDNITSLTPGPDSVEGAGGADTVVTGDGADTVEGGAGADLIIAGAGADSVDAGEDDDILVGTIAEIAPDSIEGGLGSDTIQLTDTASGAIVLDADVTGVETVELRVGDTVSGTAAIDVDASALAGLEEIIGNDGANALTAGGGAQTLSGLGGNDILTGGADADVLEGGLGTDTASYGAGLGIASFSVVGGAWQVDAGDGIDSLDSVEVVTSGGVTYRLVGAGGYASIQAAVDAAGENDVILIAPGTYTETSAGVGGGQPQGLYIDTAGLTLVGFSSATGLAVASAQEAKDSGPAVISGAQNQFGANHWIDVGGTGVTMQGLHLKAGLATGNKLFEIWADGTVIEDNFFNVYATDGAEEVYSGAVAIYLNETILGPVDAISSYDIRDNILNEGIVVASGVGDPATVPTAASNERITGNLFAGTFDTLTGEGRYDTIVINGEVNGIGWLVEPTGTPWIAGNTFANNTVPFLLRGSDNSAGNLPDAATVAEILANNGDATTTYAYVVDVNGDIVTVTRDIGSGPFGSIFVVNGIETVNLALDTASDVVFSGQRVFLNPTDILIVQSGAGTTNSDILVDDVTVQASATSADLNLSLGTLLVDGTPIAGGGVVTLTLGDYAVGLGADVDVTGNVLGNAITGNSGDNLIDGVAGNDSLSGGTGTDTLVGGDGDDVITTDGGDSIDGGADTDEVRSSDTFSLATDATAVENLTLIGTNDIDGTGDAASNAIAGNAGANVIDGGAGADSLAGGDGDDTYVVDDLGDVVTENVEEGTDLVQASVSSTLGGDIENLTLTGTGDIDGTGNDLDNVIAGNAGANVIDGAAGSDTMSGGADDDTYVVDDVGDVVSENAEEGTDLVQASVSFTVGDDIENLTLTGTGDIDGTGNTLGNVLTGNGGANLLTGAGGDDSLVGGGGLDTAAFTGNFADYTIVRSGAGLLVTGADGADSLDGIEALQFGDVRVVLVDDDGSNGFTTIQAGINAAESGDVVLVLDGAYAEATVTVNRGVTLLGANAGADGSGPRGPESTLTGTFVVAVDGVTINGFRITGGDAAVRGHAGGAAYDDLTIANNLIEGTTDSPIRFGLGFGGGIGSENWSITGNLIDGIAGNARTGMVLFNVDGLTVTDNVINHDDLGFTGRRGINLDGVRDATVEGNTIALGLVAPTDDSAASAAAPFGIQISMSDRAVEDIIVTDNDISGARTGVAGLSQRDMTNVAITGNTIGDVINGVVMNGGTTPPQEAGVTMDVAVIGNTISAAIYAVFARDLHDAAPDGPVTFVDLDITGNIVSQGVVQIGRAETFVPAGASGSGNGLLNVSGAASIDGTGGNDAVQAEGTGSVAFDGAAGDDSFLGGGGNDLAAGGVDDDSLIGGDGDDSLAGNAGNDTLGGGAGADTAAGGEGDDTYLVDEAGETVVENLGEGTDLVLSTVSATLADNVENLTLVDGASDLEDFEDFDLGPIADGENGWRYVGGFKDQEVVDLAGDQVFRMSSDPSVGDFSGPYSPGLPATAGEPGTTADFDSMQITFDFQAVVPGGDQSRLEVDFGIETGTDRNNFMVIESTVAGIRISVADPLLPDGDFDTGNGTLNNFAAFTGNRTLVEGVDASVEHSLTMVVRFFDGPDNDVIDFYLDEAYIGSSTTFENYRIGIGLEHGTAAEANQVNRLFFRGSAGPAPSNAPQDGAGIGLNQGFYFDDIAASVFDAEGPDGTGNALDNTITGNSGANVLSGEGGADTLAGGLGADTLTGCEGGDSLEGGLGIDAATYAATLTASDIQALPGAFTVAAGALEGTDTIEGVEIVEHGGAGRFLLVGNGGFGTLAAALAVAAAGDIIILQGGTHDGGFAVGFDLTILGRDGATIEGGIVLQAGDLVIEGVAIDQAAATGVGIQVLAAASTGSLALTDVALTGPGTAEGNRGVEVVANGAAVTVSGGSIADFTSGIYLNPGSSLTVIGTAFTGNVAAIGTDAPALLDVQDATFDGNGEAVGFTGGTLNPDVTLAGNTYAGATDEVKLYGTPTETLPGTFDGVVVSAPASLQDALDAADAGETIYVGAGDYGAGPFTVPAAVAAVQGGDAVVAGTLQLAAAGALTLLGTAAFAVLGTAGADTILGNDGANTLEGAGAGDSLIGGEGADSIDGGAGADSMAGGAGDDVYVVGQAGEVVSEAVGAGTDEVRSSITLTLAAQVENLTLIGAGSLNGTGNAIANLIAGGEGNNSLNGAGGSDTLLGGEGADTLSGSQGADSMEGGAGVDAVEFLGATSGVSVNLGTGLATGFGADSLSGIETVLLSALNDMVLGDAQANRLVGRDGDDTLSGGEGNDTLEGGAGGDDLFGSAGEADLATYANSVGAVAVSLNLTVGTVGDADGDLLGGIENLTGGGGNDTLEGDADNNRLEGGEGGDVLAGLAGDDTLVGGDGLDTASYEASSAAVNVQLGTGTATDGFGGTDQLATIENAIGGSVDDSLQGSAAANLLDGRNGDDQLNGGNGSDTLQGGAGVDSLSGGAQDDVLVGGAGFDILNGQGGNDTFVFLSNSDLGTTRSATDRISAFDGAGAAVGDLIDLSALDANLATPGDDAFVFLGIGNIAFGGQGAIRAVTVSNITYLEINNDADAAVDLVLRVSGTVAFTADDFIL